MATFTVLGPFIVPTKSGKGGKSINTTALNTFWTEADCGAKAGCYIFGIRFGRGTVPYYAGRTAKTLKSECFQSHKLAKYHNALTTVAKGTPVMFFLVPAISKGPKNLSAIKTLEERLIGLGLKRNANMTNIQGTKKDEPVITGVTGGGKGKPSKSASDFRKMIGL